MSRIAMTGANRGIGLELARQYRARGDDVIALCRQSSQSLEQTGATVLSDVDVSDVASVAALTKRLDGAALDLLICAAGVLDSESFAASDWAERVRHQFNVNALGPLAVTIALEPLLRDAAKLAILSSRVGSMADNVSGGNYGYRMSKAAVNMAGVNLAHDLQSRGIAVFLLHPGYVRTEMTGGRGNKSAAESAAALVALIDRLTIAETGTFWHAEGYELPW